MEVLYEFAIVSLLLDQQWYIDNIACLSYTLILSVYMFRMIMGSMKTCQTSPHSTYFNRNRHFTCPSWVWYQQSHRGPNRRYGCPSSSSTTTRPLTITGSTLSVLGMVNAKIECAEPAARDFSKDPDAATKIISALHTTRQ